MARNVNMQQLQKLVEESIPCLIANKDEYEIPTLEALLGLVSRRVFTKGQSTTGKTRKYRSAKYSRKKKKSDGSGGNAKFGRVNLVDTGNLQRDFGVHIDKNGDNALGFINAPATVRNTVLGRTKKGKRYKRKRVASKAYTMLNPSTTKVEAEEKRRGDTPIFNPTNEEQKRVFKIHAKLIGTTFKNCIDRKINV